MLTTAQQATLLADIAANTATAPGATGQIKDLAHTGDNAFAVALWYNLFPAVDYFVWRTSVSRPEVQGDPGFDWTRVDNLSVGKARIWDGMFNSTDSFPPWKANYRTGIDAVWVGTQADLDVRTAVKGACRRKVTNFEKLFVSVTVGGPAQTGARGSTTNPDTFGVGTSGEPIEGPANDAIIRGVWGI